MQNASKSSLYYFFILMFLWFLRETIHLGFWYFLLKNLNDLGQNLKIAIIMQRWKNIQMCHQCLCKKNPIWGKIFAKFYAVLSRK